MQLCNINLLLTFAELFAYHHNTLGANADAKDTALLDSLIVKNARLADPGKYRKLWDTFQDFVQMAALDGFSAIVQMRAFAMHEIKRGLKVKTAVQYLSIIKTEGQARSETWLASETEGREYREIPRSLHRLFAAEDSLKEQPKHAVTEREVSQLMNAARRSALLPGTRGIIVAAVISLLFGGLMRANDLMNDMAVRPTTDNVAFDETGTSATIRLPRRKTSGYDPAANLTVQLFHFMPGNPVAQLRILVEDAKIDGRAQLVPSFLDAQRGVLHKNSAEADERSRDSA